MIHDTFGNRWQVGHNLVTGEYVQVRDFLPAVDAGDFCAGLLADQLFEDCADVAHVIRSRTIVAPGPDDVSVLTGPVFGWYA